MKNFFRQYFYLLDKPAKKQLPFLVLIFLFSSLFDVLGIGMIGAFLLLVLNINLLLDHVPASMHHLLMMFGKNGLVSTLGILIIIAFMLKAFIGVYSQKRIVFFIAQYTIRLKGRLMQGYQKAAYSFHLRENTAYLINRVMQVDRFTNGVLTPSLNIISNTLIALGVIMVLLILHPIITFLLALTFSIIIFAHDFFVKKEIMHLGRIISVAAGHINKSILEALGGLKEIRVLGKEKYFFKRLERASSEYATALAKNAAFQQTPRYTIESGAAVFLVILMLGALWLGFDPVNIVPTMGVFAAACVRLLPTVNQLIIGFNQARSNAFGVGMLYDEFIELNEALSLSLELTEDIRQLPFSEFSLDHVVFHYPQSEKNALLDVSMSIKKGQSIGLVGSSGAGKSTLVNIILGILTPSSGGLLVDNKLLNNLRQWLNNFAYIPQQIFLLDNTLKKNIALGVEEHCIDEAKLKNAIDMAQLVDVVNELPEGVDTPVGENGVRLSGGQRQRVALARAFYHERDIIVMDEATSALDNETEKEVITAIKRLHGIKTMIVIAHRLTTIRHCDVVYQLESGQIVKQGNFEEVIGKVDQLASS